MVFMESPRTEEECRTLVKETGDVPVLINVLPNVRQSQSRIHSGAADRRHVGSHAQLEDRRVESAGLSGCDLPVYAVYSRDAGHATVVWRSESHGYEP
jgi:hypothetical protein